MNIEALDFVVISVRTGNAIAAFLLPRDAVKYIAYRRSIEGPNGPAYEIQNADGSLVSYALDQQVAIANEGTNPYRLVAENASAAQHSTHEVLFLRQKEHPWEPCTRYSRPP